jgi:hypothetical protein
MEDLDIGYHRAWLHRVVLDPAVVLGQVDDVVGSVDNCYDLTAVFVEPYQDHLADEGANRTDLIYVDERADFRQLLRALPDFRF